MPKLVVLLISLLLLWLCICSCKKTNDSSTDSDPELQKTDGNENGFLSGNNFRELEPKMQLRTQSQYDKFYPSSSSPEIESTTELTQKERLLAYGYELLDDYNAPFNPPKRFEPVSILIGMMSRYYAIHRSMPVDVDSLFKCYISFYQKELVEQGKTPEDARKEFDDMIRSPITGKPLEWWSTSFSPGNVYIAIINDNPEALRTAESDISANEGELRDQLNSMYKGLRVYIYCRVYGESCTIGKLEISKFWSDDEIQDMKTKIDGAASE